MIKKPDIPVPFEKLKDHQHKKYPDGSSYYAHELGPSGWAGKPH